MEKKFTRFTSKLKRGMEGTGDSENEWLTSDEIQIKQQTWDEYVKKLKETGKYGEEYTITLDVEYDPLYDNCNTNNKTCESYRFDILDFSKII